MTDGPTPTAETWTGAELDALRAEFGAFAGRTVLVTGADGFMGSHVTEALVALGASVHVFVRATSSGALNNISHLRGAVTVHWGDSRLAEQGIQRLGETKAKPALGAVEPLVAVDGNLVLLEPLQDAGVGHAARGTAAQGEADARSR